MIGEIVRLRAEVERLREAIDGALDTMRTELMSEDFDTRDAERLNYETICAREILADALKGGDA